METFLIFIIIMGIVSVPLVLLYFLSQRNWRLKKIDPKEQKEGDRSGWNLLGYILMVVGLFPGAFLGMGSDDQIVRILLFTTGAVILFRKKIVARFKIKK